MPEDCGTASLDEAELGWGVRFRSDSAGDVGDCAGCVSLRGLANEPNSNLSSSIAALDNSAAKSSNPSDEVSGNVKGPGIDGTRLGINEGGGGVEGVF